MHFQYCRTSRSTHWAMIYLRPKRNCLMQTPKAHIISFFRVMETHQCQVYIYIHIYINIYIDTQFCTKYICLILMYRGRFGTSQFSQSLHYKLWNLCNVGSLSIKQGWSSNAKGSHPYRRRTKNKDGEYIKLDIFITAPLW